LDGIVTLVAAGQADRGEVVRYFAALFRGKLRRECSNVWDALVSCSSDIHPEELLVDIESAFRDGMIDPNAIGIEDVRADLARGRDETLARLAFRSKGNLVGDAVSEVKWLANFEDMPPLDNFEFEAPEFGDFDPDDPDFDDPGLFDSDSGEPVLATPTTVRYATPKIGRNEPCPCGSGKKYKKCCGF
jgi:hypothetical protein